MSAGYSERGLREKLGLKSGLRAFVANAPPDYEALLAPLPDDVAVEHRLAGTFDFLHAFVTERADLEKRFPKLVRALDADGMLWISWPKKTSRVASDLTEDVVRAVALAHGLVDVKVCAVDRTWSALKIVHRVEDRAKRRR
jgi:hypothetical protein